MDESNIDMEDGNGKRTGGENLTVVPSKRAKEDKETSSGVEVSKHEKPSVETEVSKARQRWNLLSYYLRCNCKKEANDVTNDVEAAFVVFEAFLIPKDSSAGRWYHLKSPVGNIHFDVHIYSTVTITPNVLVGFNNSGNIKIWPSEECLAYYLLKHEKLVQGKTVLELGSGMVGLSGLTSAALGAAEVVLTDGNEKSVENIRQIIEMNKLSSRVTCCVLSWDVTMPNRQFDAVLCADCLYFTEEHDALLDCTYNHLKPGGVAYIVAPDRGGTVRAFLDLVYEGRKRWQGASINFHIENEAEIYSRLKYQEIVDAIHYSCMLIQDEVVEKLEAKGQEMEFDKEVVAQVAFSICDTLCGTWPSELLQYAKHARRSVVNISDLKLLFRRNENVLSFISNIVESSSLPARKRHFRKTANKKSAKVTNSTEKADNEDMGSLLSENKSTLKLTDFWNQSSAIRGRPLHSTSNYTSEIKEEKFSSNLISLKKEMFAANEKETPSCSKQTTNAVARLRKTKGKRERGRQEIQTIDEPASLNSFDSKKKEELEAVRTVASTSLYSSDEKILQTVQSITNSCSGANRELYIDESVNNDLFMEIKIGSPKNSILLLDNKARVENSTAEVTVQKTPNVGKDKVNKSEGEFGILNQLDEKPVFLTENLLLNSIKKKSERQELTSRYSKNKSSAADDCFSSFKFESDEDSDQSHLPGVNEVFSDSFNVANSGLSTNSPNRPCQNGSLNNQKEQQNIGSEESVIDLDATVFDF